MNNVSEETSRKNLEIISEFYRKGKTFVTKEELISLGFDFSEWFSTSDLRHYFDKEENIFEYRDFKCGVFYIKTRDKNLENIGQNARLFFQIIRLEFSRLEPEFNKAIKLLHDRKFTYGTERMYRFELDRMNEADTLATKLKTINSNIATFLPHLDEIILSLEKTKNVFEDLKNRLNKKETDDEKWV